MQSARLFLIGVFAALPALAHAQSGGERTPAKDRVLTFGDPIVYRNITLVPVSTNDPGPFQRYTLLETGLRQKTLAVRERAGSADQAQVSEVEIKNQGELPVFLLGGEMILGGKQDRIIQADTIVPNDKKWHAVSVFCVEQGRWSGQQMKFDGSGAIAHLKLQEAAMSGEQGKVWEEVARKNATHGTTSETQTYRRTIQNATVRKRIAEYRAELEKLMPSVTPAGVIFAINGEIQMADLFGNPLLFADLKEKLLSAYILEAMEHQVSANAPRLGKKAASDFMDSAKAAPSKGEKVSGDARNYQMESDEVVGTETIDEKTHKPVRGTYINKKKK